MYLCPSQALVHLAQVEVGQHVAEVVVVHDALEDGFVGIHAADDGVHELGVEHEAEVVEGVVL